MTVRVLIADDHPLVHQGLKAALAPLPEVGVVAEEATTGSAAIREAVPHRPDVVVMDLQMPRPQRHRRRPVNSPEPSRRRRSWS
jgi:DNA-binding NarL/FixJ family response regulator